MITFDVLDQNRCHIDTSKTLLGAMRYATKNGYREVSGRFDAGYTVAKLATKKNLEDCWSMTSYGADLKQRGLI